MKTLIKVLLIATALFLIGAIAILYAIYNSDSAEQEVLEEKTFDAEIEDMEIIVENSRVDFLPSNDGTSRIVLTGNSDDFILKTDISGGRLFIEVEDRSRFFVFGFHRSYSLQVYVPEEGLESLTVDSNNGTIQAQGIRAAELSLEADNGRIDLEAVESDVVNIETANGAIDLAKMDADMTVRSSNGRIIFTDVSGELQAKANNGRIELTTDTLDFPVDFETNNGRIEIHTKNEPANARLQARVENGRLEVFGRNSGQVSYGSGDVLIKLATKNGRIVVD